MEADGFVGGLENTPMASSRGERLTLAELGNVEEVFGQDKETTRV